MRARRPTMSKPTRRSELNVPTPPRVKQCFVVASIFVICICKTGSALAGVSSKALRSPIQLKLKSGILSDSLISPTVKESSLRLRGGSSLAQVFIVKGTRPIAPALMRSKKYYANESATILACRLPMQRADCWSKSSKLLHLCS